MFSYYADLALFGLYIYIVLKMSNRMHKFLFYMANRFHVKKQFSKQIYIYIYIYFFFFFGGGGGS